MSKEEARLMTSSTGLNEEKLDNNSSISDGEIRLNHGIGIEVKGKRASIISMLIKKLFPMEKDKIISLSHEVKEYKEKMMQSKLKLENFFGQSIPFDINISEIEAHGLKAILQSKVPMCYFMYSMLEDYSAENLFFILEVEQYESTNFDSTRLKKKVANGLYNIFIKNGAEFEVNLEDKIKAPILDKILKGNQHCFSEAKEHILRLMEPKVQNFKNCYVFEKMKKELGYTSIYSKAARNAGVRLLLRNLDKNLPARNTDQKGHSISKNYKKTTPTSMEHEHNQVYSQKRNYMLRGMIHAFCIIRLGVDFIDRNYSVSHVSGSDSPLPSPKNNRVSTVTQYTTRSEKKKPIDVIDFGQDEEQEPDPFEMYLETLKA